MHSIAWWPTVVVLAVSTFTDLRSRRIPNWLVFPFLAAGLAVSFAPKSWHGIGILQSLEGMGLGLLVFGILACMGGMGMGDVKLCAAIGAWVGPQQLFLAMIVTAAAGGIIVLVWALCGFVLQSVRRMRHRSAGSAQDGEQPGSKWSLATLLGRKMPYAPAIAIGTLVSFFAH